MTTGDRPISTAIASDGTAVALSTRAALGIAAALTLVAFAGSLRNEFVWDDDRQIVDNHLIQDPRYFGEALRSDVWAFRAERPGAASNYWRPATVVWMIVQYALFGAKPLGWHVVNVAAHFVNVVLVFYVVRRLTQSVDVGAIASWLFAVHPVHVESVVWPSASVDIQMCLGVLPALLIYLKRRDAWRMGQMTLAALFYAFAMFSKETSIFFPALIFGAEWCFASGAATVQLRRAIRAAAPFLVVVGIYLLLRFAVVRILYRPPSQAMGLRDFTVFVPQALAFYLRQCLIPVFLSPIHSFRTAPDSFRPWLWFSPLALAFVIVLVCRIWRRGGIDVLAGLIFILPLSLAIWGARSFPPDERVHDRYLYLPVLGVILFVMVRLAARRRALIGVGGSLSVAFALLSASYGREWRSNTTLWECAVRRAPHAPIGYVHLIDAYRHADPPRPNALAECHALAQRALAIDPSYIETILAAGLVAADRGDDADAERKFRTILEHEKLNQTAMDQLAQLYLKQRRFAEAFDAFEAARRAFPLLRVKYTTNIAVVAYMAGDYPRAAAELESIRDELDRQPDASLRRYHVNLGELYVRLGRPQDAIDAYRHFLDVSADSSDPATLAARRRVIAILDELTRSR